MDKSEGTGLKIQVRRCTSEVTGQKYRVQQVRLQQVSGLALTVGGGQRLTVEVSVRVDCRGECNG